KNPSVSADPIAKPAAQTRAESRVVDLRKRLRERDRLSAGGRWIRTSGSAPAATPLADRGVKPQATAAGCHFGEILPQGGDLDDGTVSQLLEELAGEMNRPSDRKRRISGYGDRTWGRN